LWGYNLGAYAALREAESDKRVRALVLDSAYDKPEQMVKVGRGTAGVRRIPADGALGAVEFDFLNRQYRGELPLSNSKE